MSTQNISPYEGLGTHLTNFKKVPRFGHTKDFSMLFSPKKSDGADYAQGTIFIGCIFCAFLFMWLVLVLYWICMGPENSGFLSGFAMTESPPEEGRRRTKRDFKTPRRVYSIFLVSGSLLIGTSATAYLSGTRSLIKARDRMYTQAQAVIDIGREGNTLIYAILAKANEDIVLRDIVVNELQYGQFCNNALVNDLTNSTINISRANAFEELTDLDFGVDEMSSLGANYFDEIIDDFRSFGYMLGDYNTFLWAGSFSLLLFALLPYLMSMGVVYTLKCSPRENDRYLCFLTWFLLPMFIISVFVCWLGLIAVSIGIVMNVDFCSGFGTSKGPDGTCASILNRSTIKLEEPLLYSAYSSVLDGCEFDFSLPYAQFYADRYQEVSQSIQNLTTTMENVGMDELSRVCGGKDFARIKTTLDTLVTDLGKLRTDATRSSTISNCEASFPIYESIVYDEMCTTIPTAAFWLFTTLTVISIFGMILITCRAAWLPVKYWKPSEENKSPDVEAGMRSGNHFSRGPPESPSSGSSESSVSSESEEKLETVDDISKKSESEMRGESPESEDSTENPVILNRPDTPVVEKREDTPMRKESPIGLKQRQGTSPIIQKPREETPPTPDSSESPEYSPRSENFSSKTTPRRNGGLRRGTKSHRSKLSKHSAEKTEFSDLTAPDMYETSPDSSKKESKQHLYDLGKLGTNKKKSKQYIYDLNEVESLRSWEKVSVADEDALRHMSPSPRHPSFRAY